MRPAVAPVCDRRAVVPVLPGILTILRPLKKASEPCPSAIADAMPRGQGKILLKADSGMNIGVGCCNCAASTRLVITASLTVITSRENLLKNRGN